MGNAAFTPSFTDYKDLKPFRFWCQKVLPSVYDDSLSYYELLSKVVSYLNDVIDDMEAVEANTDAILDAFNQLQEYVNQYLGSEEFYEQLDAAVDAFFESEEFAETLADVVSAAVGEQIGDEVASQIDDVVAGQIDDVVAEQIGAEVTSQIGAAVVNPVNDWMDTNIDPQHDVVIDRTLKVSGAAAESKTVGDKFETIVKTANPNMIQGLYQLPIEIDTTVTADGAGSAELILDNVILGALSNPLTLIEDKRYLVYIRAKYETGDAEASSSFMFPSVFGGTGTMGSSGTQLATKTQAGVNYFTSGNDAYGYTAGTGYFGIKFRDLTASTTVAVKVTISDLALIAFDTHAEVSSWLSEIAPKIGQDYQSLYFGVPTYEFVDPTLTLEGFAADAKVVGDEIGYVDSHILYKENLTNGVWANGVFRTDGNYGKYLSNQTPFVAQGFTIKASSAILTGLVLSISVFDETYTQLNNFLTNNAIMATGEYSVKLGQILYSRPSAKYISIGVAKLINNTYYDLPEDIDINVYKNPLPKTLNQRLTAIETKNNIPSIVTVSPIGGDYQDINSAVLGITNDSASNPVTIVIKPGIYNENIHVGGDRYLSFVGENRETCIIRSHTGMYTDAPIWIDGNFTIENLTLQMLDDEAPESWTPGTSQDDPTSMLPGYALHIDGGSSAANNSIYGYKLGVVRNCTLYSVAFPAIGAGLHSNQKLIFDNCDFIRETSAKYQTAQYQYYTNYNGAMIIHDSTASNPVNQNLEIKNCKFICNLGKSATFRFKYSNPSTVKYALIDNTFWCVETNSSIVDYELNNSIMLGYSHGNNNSQFNS